MIQSHIHIYQQLSSVLAEPLIKQDNYSLVLQSIRYYLQRCLLSLWFVMRRWDTLVNVLRLRWFIRLHTAAENCFRWVVYTIRWWMLFALLLRLKHLCLILTVFVTNKKFLSFGACCCVWLDCSGLITFSVRHVLKDDAFHLFVAIFAFCVCWLFIACLCSCLYAW